MRKYIKVQSLRQRHFTRTTPNQLKISLLASSDPRVLLRLLYTP